MANSPSDVIKALLASPFSPYGGMRLQASNGNTILTLQIARSDDDASMFILYECYDYADGRTGRIDQKGVPASMEWIVKRMKRYAKRLVSEDWVLRGTSDDKQVALSVWDALDGDGWMESYARAV